MRRVAEACLVNLEAALSAVLRPVAVECKKTTPSNMQTLQTLCQTTMDKFSKCKEQVIASDVVRAFLTEQQLQHWCVHKTIRDMIDFFSRAGFVVSSGQVQTLGVSSDYVEQLASTLAKHGERTPTEVHVTKFIPPFKLLGCELPALGPGQCSVQSFEGLVNEILLL